MNTEKIMKSACILVVDDEPDNFDVIEALLNDEKYELHYISSGKDAIASLDLLDPDLILLDVMMPDMDGREVCSRIKAIPKWEALPIIMVTALTSKIDLAKCLMTGADDFISKPINSLELKARVRSMLHIRHQYEQIANFNTMLQAAVERRTEKLQRMIFLDELTELPSRAFLLQQLTEMFKSGNTSYALIYLGCDQFQMVKRSFGHTVGDQLIISIAERLQKILAPSDLLVHIEHDQFCFMIDHIDDTEELQPLIQNIFHHINKPFSVANCEIFLNVCMGIILGKNAEAIPEEVLQDANTAMYQAQIKSTEGYEIFDPQMNLAILNRLTLENDLVRALEEEEFINYYQSIINLETNKLVGFEALVRWKHPERGMVSPGEFIPSMETTGLIIPVGIEVLKEACQQLKKWQKEGNTELMISVNFSVRQFSSPTLLTDVDQILRETDVNPAYLKLEITESAIMDNPERAIVLTKELRSRGIKISIDDFGTGYSSLGYLYSFPVDNLKIDRSFVNKLQSENNKYQIVETIVNLSKKLNLSVTAEGIETTEQLQSLKELNCDFGQGYLFAKPLPAKEIDLTKIQLYA